VGGGGGGGAVVPLGPLGGGGGGGGGPKKGKEQTSKFQACQTHVLRKRRENVCNAYCAFCSVTVLIRKSAPVQTRPGAHPTSYTMGTGSFPGVKRSGSGVDHPPPSSAEVKERV